MKHKPNLQNKVAVVTGASRGLGYAISCRLASFGAHIIACGRTIGALEELDDHITQNGGTCTITPFDLSDGAAIDRLGSSIHQRWGKLDILVGCAAQIGVLSPLPLVDPKVWHQVFSINVEANYRLLRSLHPLLTKADYANAILVSDGQARKHSSFWGPYSASKLALEAMVGTYKKEVARSAISVDLLVPPPMPTRLRSAAMPGEDFTVLAKPDTCAKLIDKLVGNHRIAP